MTEALHGITHSDWFVGLDLLFHVVVIGHVLHHAWCVARRCHHSVGSWRNRRTWKRLGPDLTGREPPGPGSAPMEIEIRRKVNHND